MKNNRAVLIISHGSQFSKTKEEIDAVVAKLKAKSKIEIFEYAFLDIESPSIPDGIKTCVKRGATEICVLPNFLNSGRHLDVDIPRIIEEARKKYPRISITTTHPIGQHPKMIDLLLEMIE